MRILYATDGSTPAQAAESLITALFDRSAAAFEVVTVTPQPTFDLVGPGGLVGPVPLAEPEQVAEHVARTTAERLAASGFRASFSTSSGDPAVEILRIIAEGGHGLVVLGGSHTTWMGTFLLGRVSMHVLHHAPCSVLVTHRAPTGTGRILIGADGSAGSAASIVSAAAFLDRDRCSVGVASVVSHPWILAPTSPVAPMFGPGPDAQRIEGERVEHARAVAQRASAEARKAGFSVLGESVLIGSAGSQLLKEADNIGAELVVVGSRGRGPVSRAVLGSVSDQVVRHAPAAFVGRIGP